jgi:hypothetical protein
VWGRRAQLELAMQQRRLQRAVATTLVLLVCSQCRDACLLPTSILLAASLSLHATSFHQSS